MDAHSLSTVGRVAESQDESGNYVVRCPRCDYVQDGLTRTEACERARKNGCPDCVTPTDDLAADEGEVGDLLTKVGNPLAVKEQ